MLMTLLHPRAPRPRSWLSFYLCALRAEPVNHYRHTRRPSQTEETIAHRPSGPGFINPTSTPTWVGKLPEKITQRKCADVSTSSKAVSWSCYAKTRLTISSETVQSFWASAASWEMGLDWATLQLAKYLPETSASPGCVAAYTSVAAPWATFFRATGPTRVIVPARTGFMCRCSPVLMTPGCTALAVLRLPWNLLESSLANSKLANLD